MEIYQLNVFLEVARCLSFTEAADALNLTQPAVSAKIKSLESALQTPLFNRLGRRIELTQAGQYLLEEGPQLIDLADQLVAEIDEIKQGKLSSLKVGCMADISSHWLPSFLFKYRQKYPQVQAKCIQFDAVEDLYRAIKTGEADIGISELSFSAFDEMAETIIDTVQYSLVVSPSHHLAQQPWLSLKELCNQSWVLLSERASSRIILEKRMAELGLSLADFAQVEIVDSPSLVRTYVMQGQYLSFASEVEFQLEQQAGLMKRVALEEFALGLPLYLVISKRLSRALETRAQQPFRGRQALEPIQQLIEMLAHWPRPANEPSRVARFQSPNFRARSGPSSVSETLTLTIGTQNRTIQTATAGLIIQRLGLLEHFLPREGRYSGTQYRLRWKDYDSGAPIVAGLKAQQIDIGILGDYPLLLSAGQDDPTTTAMGTRLVSFVASNPDGAGNDIIVPQNSQLHCIEDLDGRVIAVPFSSAAHSMVMRSLHHRQLLNQVTLTSIDNLNTQQRGRNAMPVDGYAYFAPFHEIARHQGQFRQLLKASLDGLPTFHGVVVQQDLADSHPEIVVAYLKALLAAQYWYQTQPMATTLVSRWVNMDAAIVAKTLLARERTGASHVTTGVYLPETQIHTDWLQAHIQQLSQIDGHEHLPQLNLDRWVQPEFLASAIAAI
ncbi:LysR family transcriptional regulator [Romeria aff. gracilis LEGE 07310]|uniref:LysR family transcriptional regulator n=1 Tax=Vasconcelosia minhoensis LEGE 07310 TaxID=915328 RepID=A0A8J7A832_9CYAN|nr:LysR substrate-binding domain-containing protein [Romeria gracilis]MBE9077785.1 LysR family transcriptional regulator [Romeria aff. gracilis LEGE 07310]